ncbi:CreA family protein [Uliginosibacterium paludis]|jgi:CreA protein|uniref:CreA family protein n=1 Tax=Uliginosibacterium paludis TaxID=1615952 RepID=A0ABV2CND6_9RHOO
MIKRILGGLVLLAGLQGVAQAEAVGEVDTTFKLLGPDNKIVVQVFDDPRVGGVSCYLSRAKTGGIKGAVGLAEDTADASVACRQVGEISFREPLRKQEEVFTERSSVFFKRVRVVRMVDSQRNALVYLVYSDRLVDGSPKNSVTAVAVPQSLRIPLR